MPTRDESSVVVSSAPAMAFPSSPVTVSRSTTVMRESGRPTPFLAAFARASFASGQF